MTRRSLSRRVSGTKGSGRDDLDRLEDPERTVARLVARRRAERDVRLEVAFADAKAEHRARADALVLRVLAVLQLDVPRARCEEGSRSVVDDEDERPVRRQELDRPIAAAVDLDGIVRQRIRGNCNPPRRVRRAEARHVPAVGVAKGDAALRELLPLVAVRAPGEKRESAEHDDPDSQATTHASCAARAIF